MRQGRRLRIANDPMSQLQHSSRGRPGVASSSRANESTLHSFIGGAAVVAGTAAAIVCIPNNLQPSDALFWPAIWCALGLLVVPVLRMRKYPSSILRIEHALMVGLIYWLLLDLIQSAYSMMGVSHADAIVTFGAIGMMALGIWVGAAGKGWTPPKAVLRVVSRPIETGTLFKAVLTTFFLGMFYFAFASNFDPWTMIDGLGKSRFAAPWSRSALGGWQAFVEHLQYFGYVLPSLTVLIAHQKGWMRWQTIVSLLLSLVMILFLAQLGGRRIIGVVGGAALVSWLLLQNHIRPRLVIGGLLGLAILLGGMHEMLRYRGVGFAALLRNEAPKTSSSYLSVDDNFLRLAQVVHLFPDVLPYAGVQPLIYALSRPIPRVVWPEKPTGPGYDLSALVGGGGASLSQSIVGELYAMHGLIVVFLGGFLFGRLAIMWNKLLQVPGAQGTALAYGLGLMVLFVGLRSMQDLIIMSYGLIGWLLIASVFPHARIRKAVSNAGRHN
jgi:hypothetical protein